MIHLVVFFAVFLAIQGNSIPNFEPLLIPNSLVCDADITTQKYSLAKEKSCHARKQTVTQTCTSTVFDPQFIHIPITGYLCTIKSRTYTTHKYFWGAEFLEKSDFTFSPITPQECSQMVLLKTSKQEGPLTPVSKGFWQTQNTVEPQFQWLTTLEFYEKNAFLQTTTFFYNILTKSIVSDIANTHGCNIEDNFCQTQDSTMVWNFRPKTFCNYVQKKMFFHGNINVHKLSLSKIDKISIPDLTTEFKNFVPVNDEIKKCFPNKIVYQTIHDFIIVSDNCLPQNDVKLSNFTAHLKSLNQNSEQLNFLFDSLVNDIKHLEDKLDKMSCHLENEIHFNHRLLAKVFPTQVLSKLVNREAAAAITSNVLSEFACIKAELRVLPSLRFEENKFATRPVALFLKNNVTHFVQWSSSEFWSTKISEYSTKPINDLLTFKINDLIVSYKNMKLLQKPEKLRKLKFEFHNNKIVIPEFDFTAAEKALAKTKTDEAFSSMHMALTELRIKQEILEATADPNTKTFHQAQQQEKYGSIVTPLTKIHNPFLIILFWGLHLLGNLYTVIVTITLIVIVYKSCKLPSHTHHNTLPATDIELLPIRTRRDDM